jgi:transcriptional regulator with XRE-family HTH domain
MVGMRNKFLCDFDTQFGSRVKNLRILQQLTQKELGEKIGTSAQLVQSIEASRRGISAGTLYGLSKALGVGMDELYTGNDKTGASRNINEELMDKFKQDILHKIYDCYVDLCQKI